MGECTAFSTALNQFLAAMRVRHEQCLADNNRITKPVPEANGSICSQRSCQYYHDYAYGPRAVDDIRQVSACVEQVNRYLTRKAEEAKFRDQQERARKAEEARIHEQQERLRERQRQQLEQDRIKRAEWEAREAKRKADEEEARKRSAEQLSAVRSKPEKDRIERDLEIRLATIEQDRHSDRAPVPAHASSTSLVAANPGEGTDSASRLDPPAIRPSEEAIKAAVTTFETASHKAIEMLDRSLKTTPKDLTPSQLRAYVEETKDLKSVISGFEKAFKYYDYGLGTAKVLAADSDDERKRAVAELSVTLAQDIAKKGIVNSAGLLFGARVASILGGPVALGGSILVGSETVALEPSDVLRDTTGSISLADKQQVLRRVAREYDKYGDVWSDEMRSQFIDLTMAVWSQSNGN